jgi:hypothetical protein
MTDGKRARLTHAESVKRQQRIVRAYDVEHQTFSEIARQLTMGEKEVREAYRRYVNDMAPLMNSLSADEKATEYLRTLEDIAQQLRYIAAFADNDSARVGALRELLKVVFKDIELRQHLGLFPTKPGALVRELEERWLGGQIADLLHEYGMPPEALRKLEAILSGEGGS